MKTFKQTRSYEPWMRIIDLEEEIKFILEQEGPIEKLSQNSLYRIIQLQEQIDNWELLREDTTLATIRRELNDN